MISADAARNIIGITGNVISSGLFVTPAPMLWRICKAKDVEEFKPDCFLATLLSCMLWIFYGLPVVQPNNILVVTINGIGLVVEVVFLIIFFIYSTNNRRLKMLAVLGVEAAFMAALVVGVLHGAHTHEKRSMIVGILCVISGSFMYFPQITVTRKVIRDKSVEYMSFLLSLWTFLDGCCWMAYALIKFDLYVMIPHGLGAFVGLIQLFLYFFYYKSTPKKKNTELPTVIVDALLGQSWGVPDSSVYFLLGPCSSVVRQDIKCPNRPTSGKANFLLGVAVDFSCDTRLLLVMLKKSLLPTARLLCGTCVALPCTSAYLTFVGRMLLNSFEVISPVVLKLAIDIHFSV